MNNFLNFIEEDIETKKFLISTLPKKNDTNIRKYNSKISEFIDKYEEYEMAVRNYLIAKSNSFKMPFNKKNIDDLNSSITSLEYIKFLLNPTNTYFEKMGFDNLLYRMINYYEFNISSLEDIINEFLDKFELIGIKLDADDFKYTCYVYEYMSTFFKIKYSNETNYEPVTKKFEQIYWVNPEIVQHIELNLKKVIKKHEKDFNNYIEKLKKEIKSQNNIENYNDCLEKLKDAYEKYNMSSKEDISDIVILAKNSEIDMTQFFEDSKFRMASFDYLIKDSAIIKDEKKMIKIYDSLEKLLFNVKEYKSYVEFIPLFDNFKTQYESKISNEYKNGCEKESKETWKNIEDKEKRLDKINKKIFSNKTGIFEINNDSYIKQLRIESTQLAKELYDLYKIYDQQYFDIQISKILNKYLSLSDLLNLYYSFDYFKKFTLKEVFNIESYEELNRYSDNFDLFAMNSLNVITNGILVFEENDIVQIIINKYKINDIFLDEEILGSGNLDNLEDKINFLLRVKCINDSKYTVEQIWFMSKVEEIIKKENE